MANNKVSTDADPMKILLSATEIKNIVYRIRDQERDLENGLIDILNEVHFIHRQARGLEFEFSRLRAENQSLRRVAQEYSDRLGEEGLL
jgi:SHS2 domain-containing protein